MFPDFPRPPFPNILLKQFNYIILTHLSIKAYTFIQNRIIKKKYKKLDINNMINLNYNTYKGIYKGNTGR